MAARLGFMTLVMAMATGCARHTPPATGVESIAVVIGGQRFELELALDGASRFAGLSDRPRLDAEAGMLFVFPTPRRTAFVMRRCQFPIDLIYLGPGGRVDRIQRMTVEPPDTAESDLRRYPSAGRVQFAIELVGGTLDRLVLAAGDKVELPLEALKRRSR